MSAFCAHPANVRFRFVPRTQSVPRAAQRAAPAAVRVAARLLGPTRGPFACFALTGAPPPLVLLISVYFIGFHLDCTPFALWPAPSLPTRAVRPLLPDLRTRSDRGPCSLTVENVFTFVICADDDEGAVRRFDHPGMLFCVGCCAPCFLLFAPSPFGKSLALLGCQIDCLLLPSVHEVLLEPPPIWALTVSDQCTCAQLCGCLSCSLFDSLLCDISRCDTGDEPAALDDASGADRAVRGH